jgi:hypothetical protein
VSIWGKKRLFRSKGRSLPLEKRKGGNMIEEKQIPKYVHNRKQLETKSYYKSIGEVTYGIFTGHSRSTKGTNM